MNIIIIYNINSLYRFLYNIIYFYINNNHRIYEFQKFNIFLIQKIILIEHFNIIIKTIINKKFFYKFY